MGYASAVAMILFAILLIVTLIQWQVANRWVYGFDQNN
jgi:multiple sugar transport system permease protein